jgi:transposase
VQGLALRPVTGLRGEPETREALDVIRDVYLVEHAAKERGIAGTPAHRALRQAESAPITHKLKACQERDRGFYQPKSKFGVALRDALPQ